MKNTHNKIVLTVLVVACLARADNIVKWKTLNGDAPLVIARGGFSGIFPDSSSKAYEWAGLYSLPNVILWCDVQLTKDEKGICFPDIRLESASNIDLVYRSKEKDYKVNGKISVGWFSTDYTYAELSKISLLQRIGSRPFVFNANQFPLLTVEDVANQSNAHGLWLNIQHDMFLSLKNLYITKYVLSLLRSAHVSYISSPELGFLKSIRPWVPAYTKLIFSFKGDNGFEPSTNTSYTSLLGNLSVIKEFATGIILPKEYIYPVGVDLYLEQATSVVEDAHIEGLEVFCYSFANDAPYAYDYGYDPMAEYVHFIDNGRFSIDGVISDYPITPSAAIACYSNIGKNAPAQENPLVISSGGSSGHFTGCTDDAYQLAINNGADIIGCPVQITKDGIPFCLGSIDLANTTTVLKSNYSSLATTVPELGSAWGIFSFSLTWSQIKTLTPSLSSLCLKHICLPRDPKYARFGKFVTLSQFLDLTKDTNSISGLLISIEHAPYLAEKQNLHVVDSVLAALENVSHKLKAKRVMIQSTDKSVLSKFGKERYEIVYKERNIVVEAESLPIGSIQSFANAVVLNKESIYLQEKHFLLGKTNIVEKLRGANLAVYVELFRNEYIIQAYDYMLDPYVEINTFTMLSLVDGVITEYPGTAAKYKRNRCQGLGNTPPYMLPILPGRLRQLGVGQTNEEKNPSTSKWSNITFILGMVAILVCLIVITLLCIGVLLLLIEWHFGMNLVPGPTIAQLAQWCWQLFQAYD